MEEKSKEYRYAVAIGVALISALICMLLWNWLLPDLFNFPTITYWQMLGIMTLVRLIPE